MIPPPAQAYLTTVDERLPGFAEGVYLVGSAALGAWQAGVSDVDLIVFTSRPPTADDLADIAEVHAENPGVDGVYLEPGLAGTFPSAREIVPFVMGGELQTGKPCGELTPVVWLIFHKYGVSLRGPDPADLAVPVSAEALRRYNLDNLREYWRAAAEAMPGLLADVPPDLILDAETVTWYVHGPARLHYTLATGDIIAKSSAGPYLASLFPEYADLARRATEWRTGADVSFVKTDLLTAAESVIAVADDAWRRFGQSDGTADGAGAR